MNRKLPVYLVVDCSHSMRGKPIEMVNSGIKKMIKDLSTDPMAIETVWLSIITFSTGAEQIIPLTEIFSFRPPELIAKGKTDMGAGLRLLAERIDIEVRRTSTKEKGDWKPVAFLLSDGGPGDSWITPAKEIRARHDAGHISMTAVAFGEKTHLDKLKRVTPQVLVASSFEAESFASFLQWVSMSLCRSCQTGSPEDYTDISFVPPPGFFIP